MEFKKQFSMKEASEILGLKDYQIRNIEKYLNLKFSRNENNERFFTQNDIELLQAIKKAKYEKSLSYNAIKKELLSKGIIEEQKENALETTTFNNLTPNDFKEIVQKMIAEVIITKEEEMMETVKDEIEELKAENNQLKEVIQSFIEEQRARDIENLKQQEESNKKLQEHIDKIRSEEKNRSLWGKIFGK